VDYDEVTMKTAVDDVHTYDNESRCLGGTEIFEPLKKILDSPRTSEMRRQIFVLTDGAVYNTNELINLAKEKAIQTNSRIHTFGVGRGASTELIKGLARGGCGSYTMISKAF